MKWADGLEVCAPKAIQSHPGVRLYAIDNLSSKKRYCFYRDRSKLSYDRSEVFAGYLVVSVTLKRNTKAKTEQGKLNRRNAALKNLEKANKRRRRE